VSRRLTPTSDPCHPAVAEVARWPGAGGLWGCAGSRVWIGDLEVVHPDLVVLLAGAAFDALELWEPAVSGRVEVWAWPMPDYGVWAVRLLRQRAARLLEEIRRGRRVLVACAGGHGRTGTLCAAVLAAAGVPPRRAIKWVRERYCPLAIETEEQEEAILLLR